jgi:arylsulfatase A
MLFAALLLAPLAATRAADAPNPSKPNIIFILADDLGLPHLGFTGGTFKTPNIDALAKGGTYFESCFAAPLCAPSRAMLMTGRYAFRTGVTGNGAGKEATPQKDGCVAKQMKEAGYATGMCGKWKQLSYFTTREDAAKWGFDEFMAWGDAEDAEEKGGRYWNPSLNLNGRQVQDTKDKFGPDLLQNYALDFIRRHKDEPFFFYYSSPLIHNVLRATPETVKPGEKMSKEKNTPAIYQENLSYLDRQVGQIVAELDKLKLREKTLIVFTGDNGAKGGSDTVFGKELDGGKHELTEGGSRVPLIANWPGTTPAGVVKKDLVVFTDMLPTFVELAGGKLASGITIDGRSFAPQIRGEAGKPRDWIYIHLHSNYYIRDPRWKLTDKGEFFDMKEAPFKQIAVPKNTTDPEAKAARERLQKELDKLRASAEPGSHAVEK